MKPCLFRSNSLSSGVCRFSLSLTFLSDDSCDPTHLHFYAFVKLLAGGRYGLGGAELKVPELVLHSEEKAEHRRVFVEHKCPPCWEPSGASGRKVEPARVFEIGQFRD